jgi:hypothetical protein
VPKRVAPEPPRDYEPPKLFYLANGEYYHATPRCPEIPSQQRKLLAISQEGEPVEGLWTCDRCCPVDLVIPSQAVYRPPIYFHSDENCLELAENVRGAWRRLEWIFWPALQYRRMVDDDGTSWKRCRRCLPTVTTLYPLGSAERPG